MADKLDIIMRAEADNANAAIDYAAMREAILEKARQKRSRERSVLRILSAAAGLVIIAGVGAAFLFPGGGKGATDAAAAGTQAPMAAAYAYTEEAVLEEAEDSGVAVQTVPAEEPAAEEPMPEASDETGAGVEAAQEELPVYDEVVPIPSCACQYFEYVGMPVADVLRARLSAGEADSGVSPDAPAISIERIAEEDIAPDILAALAIGEAYVDGDLGEAVWRTGEQEYLRAWGDADDLELLEFIRSLCE